MATKSLTGLLSKEADEIRRKIYEESFFFNASFEVIAKHFLSQFIEGNLFAMPFNEIRTKFIAQAYKPEALPEDDADFFEYVCKEYLNIQSLPSRSLSKYYQNASDDFKSIDINISQYQSQIDELERKKGKTEEEGYHARLLKYYLDLNLKAKTQIVKFITYDIKEYALFDCLDHPTFLSIFYHGVPYDYRITSSRFRVEYLSDLNNKFLELEIRKHAEITKLYEQKGKEEFYKRMNFYIKDYGIVKKIEELINEHHRLDRRKKIFSEALTAYNGGSKYLFCNVVPSQIEGIFYDYCLELGIPEDSVNNATLTEKLQLIININPEYS